MQHDAEKFAQAFFVIDNQDAVLFFFGGHG
jgi:hypothetical protein